MIRKVMSGEETRYSIFLAISDAAPRNKFRGEYFSEIRRYERHKWCGASKCCEETTWDGKTYRDIKVCPYIKDCQDVYGGQSLELRWLNCHNYNNGEIILVGGYEKVLGEGAAYTVLDITYLNEEEKEELWENLKLLEIAGY